MAAMYPLLVLASPSRVFWACIVAYRLFVSLIHTVLQYLGGLKDLGGTRDTLCAERVVIRDLALQRAAWENRPWWW